MDLVGKTGELDQIVTSEEFAWGNEVSRRIRIGDVAAEAELIRRFQPGLRVLLRRRIGGDPGLIDDLVQETLLIVLLRLRGEGVSDPSRLAAFAAQTARNLAIGGHRKQHRQKTDTDLDQVNRMASSAAGIESVMSEESVVFAVQRMLRELPSSRDRDLLKRVYLDDEDRDTVCREFSLTEAALNQALARARHRFRTILQSRGLGKSELLCVIVI